MRYSQDLNKSSLKCPWQKIIVGCSLCFLVFHPWLRGLLTGHCTLVLEAFCTWAGEMRGLHKGSDDREKEEQPLLHLLSESRSEWGGETPFSGVEHGAWSVSPGGTPSLLTSIHVSPILFIWGFSVCSFTLLSIWTIDGTIYILIQRAILGRDFLYCKTLFLSNNVK